MLRPASVLGNHSTTGPAFRSAGVPPALLTFVSVQQTVSNRPPCPERKRGFAVEVVAAAFRPAGFAQRYDEKAARVKAAATRPSPPEWHAAFCLPLPIAGWRRHKTIVARCACLRLDQIAANCEADQIAKTLKLHFAHDVVAVAFHRARGNAEHRSRLLVAFPAR